MTFAFSKVIGEDIYYNNFNHYSENQIYTEFDLAIDWFAPSNERGVVENRAEIVTGSEAFGGSGASLSVKIPEGSVGTGDGGAIWRMRLPELYNELEVSYRVKFKEGFDFVRGGKLPGLSGQTSPTGQARSSFDKGWSGRLMWRTEDLARNPFTNKHDRSYLVHYLKHPASGFDQAGQDEDNLFWHANGSRITIESGKWYQVTQRIRMNDPGKMNGRVSAWLDGVMVSDDTGFAFRGDLERGIDRFSFAIFFGGGDSTWEATRDEEIFLDDFTIKTVELKDELGFKDAAASLRIGGTTFLPVAYGLKESGFINLNVFSNSGNWIAGARHFLPSGRGIADIPVTLPQGTPEGGCFVQGFVATESGDWINARAWSNTIGGSFVNQSVNTDAIKITEAPPKIQPGSSGVVKVVYEAVTDGFINVSLTRRNGNWSGGGSIFVTAGAGIIDVPFNALGSAAVDDYRFHAFLSSGNGDWQNARVWAEQAPTTVGP